MGHEINIKKFDKALRGKDVIIICSGQSILTYIDEVREYVKKNPQSIIIGCKNMSHIVAPHYHMWGDKDGFYKFGNMMHKLSTGIFRYYIPEEMIKKTCNNNYFRIKCINTLSVKKGTKGSNKFSCRKSIGNKKYTIKGPFSTTGNMAIFLAHCLGAEKITILGIDGYSYNPLSKLIKEEFGQHCYGSGFSAYKSKKVLNKKGPNKAASVYQIYKNRDKVTLYSLNKMKQYGANFEIITPTVFKKFFNFDILKIKEKTCDY
jgi:hypothetical protein